MERNKQTLLNDDEMQSIAGGLSEDAKKAMWGGGIFLGSMAAATAAYKLCGSCVKPSRRIAEVELQQGSGAFNRTGSTLPARHAELPWGGDVRG